MRGSINVESDGQTGSTFRFRISLVAGQCQTIAASDGDQSVKTRAPLRILLAEDNLVNQRVADALLTGQGHHLTIVDNGSAAVDAATSGIYDCVLMDIQMPIMDGLEATRHIRLAEANTCRSPITIIAMTAGATEDDQKHCIDAGMDGFVTKPIRFAELLRQLDKVNRSSTDFIAPIFPDQQLVRTSENTDFYNDATIDWDSLEKLTRGRPELLHNLITALLTEVPDELNRMIIAASESDFITIAGSAHKLRGAIAYFGIPEIKRDLTEVETSAEKQDQRRCAVLIEKLELDWMSVKEKLLLSKSIKRN